MKNNKPSSENNFQNIKTCNTSEYFAEVIESCLDSLTGQSWEWDFFPRFGSLVEIKAKEHTVYGCVTQIQTGSIDPTRYPFPYKKTEEELLAEQPQIFEFLKTTFTVQILGYKNHTNNTNNSINKRLLYLLPQKPCKIHAFIKESSPEFYSDFFSNPDYLHILFAFQNKINNLHELLLAIIHRLTEDNNFDTETFKTFCQTFSLLSGNDYRSLKLFLKRVEHLL